MDGEAIFMQAPQVHQVVSQGRAGIKNVMEIHEQTQCSGSVLHWKGCGSAYSTGHGDKLKHAKGAMMAVLHTVKACLY